METILLLVHAHVAHYRCYDIETKTWIQARAPNGLVVKHHWQLRTGYAKVNVW